MAEESGRSGQMLITLFDEEPGQRVHRDVGVTPDRLDP